jgi:hypothetical protein
LRRLTILLRRVNALMGERRLGALETLDHRPVEGLRGLQSRLARMGANTDATDDAPIPAAIGAALGLSHAGKFIAHFLAHQFLVTFVLRE